MRRSHLALAAALVFAAFEVGASTIHQPLPATVVHTCLTELDRLAKAEGHAESQRFDLYERCPALATKLESWSRDAGAIQIDGTSIEGLLDLQSFAAGFHEQPPSAQNITLDVNGLDALLAEVLIPDEVDDGWWERFLQWLDEYVKDGDSVEFKRLIDWLDGLELPPWLGDVILKVSVVLIVVLAIIVIGNEIRLSGVLRRSRRAPLRQALPGIPEAPQRARVRSLDELRDLPPRELAAAMLVIVGDALVERGWLSAGSSRTNGELARELSARSSDVAGPFTHLVSGVDNILYGDRRPDDATRQRLIAISRDIVERARGTAPAASAGAR